MPIAQMEQEFPEAYAEFIKVCDTLENHYHDMQDMEFTVENKKLYMLQCRNGKRTAQAALQIACDLVDEGHKTEAEAVPACKCWSGFKNQRSKSCGYFCFAGLSGTFSCSECCS